MNQVCVAFKIEHDKCSVLLDNKKGFQAKFYSPPPPPVKLQCNSKKLFGRESTGKEDKVGMGLSCISPLLSHHQSTSLSSFLLFPYLLEHCCNL